MTEGVVDRPVELMRTGWDVALSLPSSLRSVMFSSQDKIFKIAIILKLQ